MGAPRAGGTDRAYRGGDYDDPPTRLRVSSRQATYSGYTGPDIGFRCVR